MRIDERHQRQEAVVGNAEDADLAVALRKILHQPVDGVVRVGRMVHGSGVQRAMQRAVHHVVALRVVLSANVLDHADVTACDDDLGSVVVSPKDRAEMRTRGVRCELGRAIRRARE